MKTKVIDTHAHLGECCVFGFAGTTRSRNSVQSILAGFLGLPAYARTPVVICLPRMDSSHSRPHMSLAFPQWCIPARAFRSHYRPSASRQPKSF
jgi:hypothetical protein